MTWSLISVEERAQVHASFSIPPRSEREGLCTGDLAKLIFVDPTLGIPSGERMWVEIVEGMASGYYRGRLLNVPILIQDLGEGDLIEFGPEHVASWMVGP
jgi:hypothetical protein